MAKKMILGIDPGISGAFVLTDGRVSYSWLMPVVTEGKMKRISFKQVYDYLQCGKDRISAIYLERAVPMAMGSKHSFNYGRGFEAIVIAIELAEIPVTLVEPQKWAKEMHEGISNDMKPKAKSLIAVKRLFPHLVKVLPKKPKGGLLDGPVDALLIAGYGLRKQGGIKPEIEQDFY